MVQYLSFDRPILFKHLFHKTKIQLVSEGEIIKVGALFGVYWNWQRSDSECKIIITRQHEGEVKRSLVHQELPTCPWLYYQGESFANNKSFVWSWAELCRQKISTSDLISVWRTLHIGSYWSLGRISRFLYIKEDSHRHQTMKTWTGIVKCQIIKTGPRRR